MQQDKLLSIHPGEVLLEEFLKPMHLSSQEVAIAIGIPQEQLDEILQCERSLTADIALRLAQYFNTSARFWLGLQMDYDLDIATDTIDQSSGFITTKLPQSL